MMHKQNSLSVDLVSYHCALLPIKTSAFSKAQLRIIIYDNKNMPSCRKYH